MKKRYEKDSELFSVRHKAALFICLVGVAMSWGCAGTPAVKQTVRMDCVDKYCQWNEEKRRCDCSPDVAGEIDRFSGLNIAPGLEDFYRRRLGGDPMAQ
jgi:hypothetical protein